MSNLSSSPLMIPELFLFTEIPDFVSKVEILPQVSGKIKHKSIHCTIYYHKHRRTDQKMVTICIDVIRFSFTYKKGVYFSISERHPDIVFLASLMSKTPRSLVGVIKENIPHSW